MEDIREIVESTREKEERERKERELADRVSIAKSFIAVFNRGLNRHVNSGDPIIRATLLFDKLCLGVDLMNAMVVNTNNDLPEDIKKEITATSEKLSGELDYVFNYILTPQYSPDHPYGNHLMQKSAEHFNSSANSDS